MIKIHLSSQLYFGILENRKFWLAFRPRNESSKISFCLSCKSTCVQRQRPPQTGFASADSCCWVLLLHCSWHKPWVTGLLLPSFPPSSIFDQPHRNSASLHCESENVLFQMMTYLYCWRPFFTLTWTKFLAQTTLAGVGACETIPWLWESVKMDLWELQQWICGNRAFVFPGWRRMHFRWDVEHDGGGGAEPQPLTGHACHDDAGNKKIW